MINIKNFQNKKNDFQNEINYLAEENNKKNKKQIEILKQKIFICEHIIYYNHFFPNLVGAY